MRISYDPEVDALYIRLIEGNHECRTVRLNEEVALNVGAGERLVGIEILDAKEVLGQGQLLPLLLENIALAPAAYFHCNDAFTFSQLPGNMTNEKR